MTKYISFFTKAEEQEIVQAIRKAEQETSAEIRVHLEDEMHADNAQERVIELFYNLAMDKTAQQNGVLFYFSLKDKVFAIYGDRGIDRKVPNDFWLTIKDGISNSFKQQDYLNGIINGINQVGIALKNHFPYDKNTDQNELSDEISKS